MISLAHVFHRSTASSFPGGRRVSAFSYQVMASRSNAQTKLNTVVEVIGEGLDSEVCSIYLLREGMLELFATRGLARGPAVFKCHAPMRFVDSAHTGQVVASGDVEPLRAGPEDGMAAKRSRARVLGMEAGAARLGP